VHRGGLEDQDNLWSGAAASDGVIHLGFIHDFSRFQEICEIDGRTIEALGGELAGSNRPLVVTSGLFVTPGNLTSEDEKIPSNSPIPRVSEQTAMPKAAHGVRVSAVRLPQVHDAYKQVRVTYLIALGREKGFTAYVGDGINRWPAIHLHNAAPLYRSALEKGSAGARYHAVAEEGVPLREIAEPIGRGMRIPVVSKSPEEVAGHFGWLGFFAGTDGAASSALTQQRLGWRPMQKAVMIEDLDHMNWSAV
jgi:nucleoside-diphosphate-sugar epimerase